MKKIITMCIGISALLIMITGCPPVEEPVSIEERISMFEDDLNGDDRSDLYTHFHPDTESYDQIKDETFFEETPLATVYKPINFSNLSDPVDAGNDQMEVTADFSNNSYTDTCTFI